MGIDSDETFPKSKESTEKNTGFSRYYPLRFPFFGALRVTIFGLGHNTKRQDDETSHVRYLPRKNVTLVTKASLNEHHG